MLFLDSTDWMQDGFSGATTRLLRRLQRVFHW
jgi:hypothetical protein